MVKMKLILATAMLACLSLVFAGSAFAAKANCGDCHGTHNGSAKTFSSTTSWHNLRAGYNPPIYEVGYTPVDPDTCNNDGRGLHGIHMNYSSASYGKKGGTSGVVRGNCDYCHYKKLHQSGFVDISGTSTALVAGRQTITDPGLHYDFGTKTCTNACHKNGGSTAPWGNYTSPSVKLSCNACHDDVVNKVGLSGAHAKHLNSTVQVNGGLMGAAANAGCVNCHPDNTADGKLPSGTADYGTAKAYTHASDGTNVVPDNANLNAGITATKAGLGTTCAASCHPRSATITWGSAGNCDMCHYYNATPSSATNTGTGALTGSHNAHFDQGVTCDKCHTVPSDTAHASSLPVVSTNATVLASLTFNTGTLTCSSTGATCHGVGMTTPVWGTTGNGCATCHEYPGGTRDWTGDNGHMIRNAATATRQLTHLRDVASYHPLTDTYAGVTGDVNLCGKCHAGGTHRSGTVEVSDTNSLGLCSGTSFTFNATTPGSNVSCSNVKCHNGRTTPNWW